MTQTSPKHTPENADNVNDSSSTSVQVEDLTPRKNSPSPSLDPLFSLKRAGKEQKPKQYGITLRRQLLIAILPTVLVPLAIASTVGYKNIQQRAEKRIKLQVQNQSLLVGEATGELLEEALKIPAMVANNPLVINLARASAQKAEAAKLQQLPIEQVEKRFSATKLFQPNQELNDYLQRTAETTGLAELFFTERNGFNIGYSNPTSDFVQRDEQWWQKGKSDSQWIAPPDFDQSANTFSVDLIQAIAEPSSGEFLGVIKSVLPSSHFNRLANYLERTGISGSQQVQLLEASTGGVISTITAQGASEMREIVGGEAVAEMAMALVKVLQAQINPEQATGDLKTKYSLDELTVTPLTDETGEQALTTSFIHQGKEYSLTTIPGTDWVAVASIDQSEIAAAGSELILVFALTALVLGAVAVGIILVLSRQLSTPLRNLSDTAEQVASGNLDVSAKSLGTAETKTLAQTFNSLLVRVKNLLQKQEVATEQAQLLAEITGSRVLNRQDLDKLFNQALDGARKLLNAERVVVCRFNPDGRGYVSNESVGTGWPIALNEEIEAAWIPEELREAYTQGLVVPTSNVFNVDFHPDHLQLMERLQIKANLVVPLLNQGQLFGLLIAHHCSGTHEWTENEISFMKQLAGQLEVTLDQVTFLEQVEEARQKAEVLAQEQRRLTEGLQNRALELLMEVDPVSKGDLTIRASVKEDEIGIEYVARRHDEPLIIGFAQLLWNPDSFNFLVEGNRPARSD